MMAALFTFPLMASSLVQLRQGVEGEDGDLPRIVPQRVDHGFDERDLGDVGDLAANFHLFSLVKRPAGW